MTKKKWILILCALLLVVAVCAVAFWDVIVIYVAPKTVLTGALYEAMADLQDRYTGSPVALLAECVQPDGQYSAKMELDSRNDLLGQLHCDMDIQVDTENNRLVAQGVVAAERTDLDLELFMDRDFMSVSSEDLLGGNNYGITFDTFEADIRSIPLISILIGDATISEWNDSVQSISKMMNRSYRIPELPEISAEDLQRAMLAITLLPSRVERVEMQVLGIYDHCYRISYSAKGDQVAQVLGYLMDTETGADAQVNASFYLYDNSLVMAQLNGQAGGNSIRCAVEFMQEPTTRTLRYAVKEGNAEQGFCLSHTAERGDGYLTENWTLYDNFEGAGEKKALSYRWEPVMGELVLYLQPAVTMNIYRTDAGLHIQTDQFQWLMDALAGEEADLEAENVCCNLIIQKGSAFETPDYKNIDQWSIEDLLVLLGSVGSLLGLKIQ